MSSQDRKSSDPAEPFSDNATSNSLSQQQAELENDTPGLKLKQEAEEPQEVSNPRLEALAAKKAKLEETLAGLQTQRSALVAEAKLPSGLTMPESWSNEERTKSALETAKGVIKEHIALLHKYNEIKDIGQGLMGLIADKRGVRMATVMEDYGMCEKD